MSEVYQQLLLKFLNWFNSFILLLPNILIAITLVVLFFFLSRYVNKIIYRILKRVSKNEAVNKLMSNILTGLFLLVGLFVGLDIVGLDKALTSLLASAGIAGLAVGLAFQDPILNIISGAIMSFKQPFNIGDMVVSNGYSGIIKAITLRSTHIKTFTGEDVFIPNKSVLQNPLENYTLTKWRRVDIQCGVSYTDDLELVQQIAQNTINEHIDIDHKQPIEFIYTEFGDSSINFELRFWLDLSEEKNYLITKSKAIIALKKSFDQEGITIPYPIRTLDLPQSLTIEK